MVVSDVGLGFMLVTGAGMSTALGAAYTFHCYDWRLCTSVANKPCAVK